MPRLGVNEHLESVSQRKMRSMEKRYVEWCALHGICVIEKFMCQVTAPSAKRSREGRENVEGYGKWVVQNIMK